MAVSHIETRIEEGSLYTITLDAAGDIVVVSPVGMITPNRSVSWQYKPEAGGSASLDLSMAAVPGMDDWNAHATHGAIPAIISDSEAAPFLHMRWTTVGAGGILNILSKIPLKIFLRGLISDNALEYTACRRCSK